MDILRKINKHYLDIKKLASNASELDIDDAVDVVEDLEEADQVVFLDNISALFNIPSFNRNSF